MTDRLVAVLLHLHLAVLVAVVDDKWADNVEKALTRADKRISKAIDSDDYDKLRKAIEESADDVVDQINS